MPHEVGAPITSNWRLANLTSRGPSCGKKKVPQMSVPGPDAGLWNRYYVTEPVTLRKEGRRLSVIISVPFFVVFVVCTLRPLFPFCICLSSFFFVFSRGRVRRREVGPFYLRSSSGTNTPAASLPRGNLSAVGDLWTRILSAFAYTQT